MVFFRELLYLFQLIVSIIFLFSYKLWMGNYTRVDSPDPSGILCVGVNHQDFSIVQLSISPTWLSLETSLRYLVSTQGTMDKKVNGTNPWLPSLLWLEGKVSHIGSCIRIYVSSADGPDLEGSGTFRRWRLTKISVTLGGCGLRFSGPSPQCPVCSLLRTLEGHSTTFHSGHHVWASVMNCVPSYCILKQTLPHILSR